MAKVKDIEQMTNEELGLGGHTEAPMSTHIDAYYKGFHVGFTIRSEDNEAVPTTKVTNLINSLVEKGWLGSWNVETARQQLNIAPQAPVAAAAAPQPVQQQADPIMAATAPVCGIHGVNMVWREGISRSTGKPYSFYACPEKNADGTFCTFKPNLVQKGVPR